MVSYSKHGIKQHGLSITPGMILGLHGRPTPRTAGPRVPSSRTWSGLTSEERRKRWFYDKMEWFRQEDRRKGHPIKDDSDYARAVNRMWNIQREEKREGVLDGTHDYTGKGLAEGKDY